MMDRPGLLLIISSRSWFNADHMTVPIFQDSIKSLGKGRACPNQIAGFFCCRWHPPLVRSLLPLQRKPRPWLSRAIRRQPLWVTRPMRARSTKPGSRSIQQARTAQTAVCIKASQVRLRVVARYSPASRWRPRAGVRPGSRRPDFPECWSWPFVGKITGRQDCSAPLWPIFGLEALSRT